MLALQLGGDADGHLLPPSTIQIAFPLHGRSRRRPVLHYLPAHIAKVAASGQSFLQGLRPVEMKT
jgi:hypothetical protein